jgi:predicted RNA methylase
MGLTGIQRQPDWEYIDLGAGSVWLAFSCQTLGPHARSLDFSTD